MAHVVVTDAAQQKDNLCGPFCAARILGVEQDLVALQAGTTLPEPTSEPSVPRGASSRTDYAFVLPIRTGAESGTSAAGLVRAIESLSEGRFRCVPVRGNWSAGRVEALVAEGRELGARLIANLRTGRLWGSRPPVETLLAELAGEAVDGPAADWDVGHFVELEMLIRGSRGSLVVVHDSYPSLGWEGVHLQPPRVVAAALLRGDGREGGVLAVAPRAQEESVKALAVATGLEIGAWDNGSRS